MFIHPYFVALKAKNLMKMKANQSSNSYLKAVMRYRLYLLLMLNKCTLFELHTQYICIYT